MRFAGSTLRSREDTSSKARRPGIIWQDRVLYGKLPTAIAMPLTSRRAAMRFGACHLVQPTAKNGLTVPSVALVFQMTAVDLVKIGAKLGELDDTDRDQIQKLTRSLLGLP